MTERYLFRGKRLDNGEWVQGYYVRFPMPISVGAESSIHYIYTTAKDPDDNCNRYEVDPATVGQCTGLRDKNGTLIFEGDIVRYKISTKLTVIAAVKWNGASAEFNAFVLNRDGDYIDDDEWRLCETSVNLEIIGNIHNNPELLCE